jgi:hypothetical protein
VIQRYKKRTNFQAGKKRRKKNLDKYGMLAKKKMYKTRAWLKGRVDFVNFPNVHCTFTREEAMNMPSQVMFPADFDY